MKKFEEVWLVFTCCKVDAVVVYVESVGLELKNISTKNKLIGKRCVKKFKEVW